MKHTKWDEAKTAFQAVADGYPWQIVGTGFLQVENPEFQPDNGTNPYLIVAFEHDNLEVYLGQ